MLAGGGCRYGKTRIERRMKIIKLAEAMIVTKVICTFVGCHSSIVGRWKNRNDVAELPRSGRPPIFSESQRLRLIGFYCQTLSKCGGRWSFRSAACYLNAHPENVGSFSKSTINRILLSHSLKPHRSRYFLSITDPDFFPKMELLVPLLLNPPENLYAFDESPGIQVLQRLVPNLRTEGTKTRLEEFEYIRNGTLDLFLCLDVNTGMMKCEIHSDHCTKTLVGYMENHFKQAPKSETLHYILDNLNTHCSYEICTLVAKYSKVKCPPGSMLGNMEKRRQWLESRDKRIIFHFTPFHGSWLNPAEVGISIISAKCFKESYSCAEEMYESIMNCVEFRNRFMASPFNWKYKGEDLHEKAVKRFTQQLNSAESEKTELRILTKQFLLMRNMLLDYKQKVSDVYWERFKTSFSIKEDVFMKKIEDEEGPIRKKKAQSAINELKKTLDNILPQLELVA